MKISYKDPIRYHSVKVQVGMISATISRVCRLGLLIMLVFVLTGCNLPRPNSSAAGGVPSETGTPIANTPTPSSDAGSAVLNLERSVTYYYSNGSDFQQEVGKIPLVFSKAEENKLSSCRRHWENQMD